MDTTTSLSLLDALRDPRDDTAWRRFVRNYQPMIVAFARKLGLEDADAQDAAQETLAAFACGYRDKAYDRSKGRLRSWLFGIAHRKAIDIHRKKGRERVFADQADGSAFLQRIPDARNAEQEWEEQWQQAVLRECIDIVRTQVETTTFEAFRRYVLDQASAKTVAAELSISRNAVYIGKNRVISRIRDMQAEADRVW